MLNSESYCSKFYVDFVGQLFPKSDCEPFQCSSYVTYLCEWFFFGTHKFKCPLNCLLQKNYKHMFPQPLNYKWIHQYLCFTCIISQPIYYFIWRSKAWDFNRVLASSAGGPGFNPKSRTASYQRRYKNGTSSSQV